MRLSGAQARLSLFGLICRLGSSCRRIRGLFDQLTDICRFSVAGGQACHCGLRLICRGLRLVGGQLGIFGLRLNDIDPIGQIGGLRVFVLRQPADQEDDNHDDRRESSIFHLTVLM